MSKAQEKRWEIGEKLYDDFVETLKNIYMFDDTVTTPHTRQLELFANLHKKGQPYKTLLVAEMSREFQTNFQERLYAEGTRVYMKVETSYEI